MRLSKDLPGRAVSEDECRDAIANVFPVIELHHYVLPAAWPPASWLIASNGMHAGFVLAETDSRSAGLAKFAGSLSVRINETIVGSAEDAASLICPVESVRWLAGRLAQFGLRLHQGQAILTGSPLNLYPVTPGSRIVVDAPPLGKCCVEIDP